MKPTFLLLISTMALLALGCQPKTKTVTVEKTKIVKENMFKPSANCDRGVDFPGSECDRVVDDETFWLAETDIEFELKKHVFFGSSAKIKVPAHIFYEFKPPQKKSDKAGLFQRGVYVQLPENRRSDYQEYRTRGYLESGYLERISHKEIDFVVTQSSCDRIKNLEGLEKTGEGTENSFTRFYSRDKNQFFLAEREPPNILEFMFSIPTLMVGAVIYTIVDIFDQENMKDILNMDLTYDPFYFKAKHLPVQWGCSVEGQFHMAPKNMMYIKFNE